MRLGWHWILDAHGCDRAQLACRGALLGMLCALPDQLGLTRVAEPQIHEHDAGEPLLVGLVLLAESHFSLHARPALGVLHADLFSCVAFDAQRALDLLLRSYKFTSHSAGLFERGAHSLTPSLERIAGE